tara:strand:- start:2134 stop:2403 length:270 start_codon:yes stop_codon:yes gene_type:complete
MFKFWFLFFPVDKPQEHIQPSYATMRQRNKVMQQIKTHKKKLKRTFVSDTSYMNTTYRGCVVRKRARISLQPIEIPKYPLIQGYNYVSN